MAALDPVIILALPRSYSSLACAMLGQHPQMYDLLETRLFEVDLMQQWWAEFGDDNHDADGLTRVVAEVVFGHQCTQTVEEAREWLWEKRTWTSASVLKELGEHLRPLIMVEKTPMEGGDDHEILGKLRRQALGFPRAKFLHIVRHPRSYGTSHLEHLETMSRNSRYPDRMGRRFARLLDGVVIDPQVHWYRVNSTILRFLVDVAPEQHLRIRGEDLMSDPTSQLRRITRWLGLRPDPEAIEAMTHPECSPFACLGPPNAKFGGDPKFFRNPALHQNNHTEDSLEGPLSWRADGLGFGVETRLLARQFGYS
jgi:sulfotransferase family protein